MDQLLDFFEKHLFESVSNDIYDAKNNQNGSNRGQHKQNRVKEKIDNKTCSRNQSQYDKRSQASAECLPIKNIFHKNLHKKVFDTRMNGVSFQNLSPGKKFLQKKDLHKKVHLPDYTEQLFYFGRMNERIYEKTVLRQLVPPFVSRTSHQSGNSTQRL